MIIKNITKYLDKTYVKNQCNVFSSGEYTSSIWFKKMIYDVQKKLKQELFAPKIKHWDVRKLPVGVATEHEDIPGLWIIPSVLNIWRCNTCDVLKYITRGNKISRRR